MAGLVPAIHVFFNAKITGGWFYLITNRRNGILYAGVTGNLSRRAFEHRQGLIEGFSKRYGLKSSSIASITTMSGSQFSARRPLSIGPERGRSA
jgi:GIY-YIG catalytic domain